MDKIRIVSKILNEVVKNRFYVVGNVMSNLDESFIQRQLFNAYSEKNKGTRYHPI